MSDLHWDARYRSSPVDGCSWFEPTPVMSLAMLDRCCVLPGQSLVDVGGGESRLVGALLERGFEDVSVVDVSAVALESSRRRLGESADRVQWVVQDLRAWRPARQWDVWHDRAAFQFMVEPADRAAYVSALRETLVVGGSVVLATFAADGPESCSALPVARYEPDDLAALLDEAGTFDVVAALHDVHTTPSGGRQSMSWIAARRTS